MEAIDRSRGRGTLSIYRCRSCRTCFLGSIPDGFDADLYSYYEKHQSLTRKDIFSEINRQRYFALLQSFEKKVDGRTFLDVGCGLGAFVEAAIARGWHGCGIDLAKTSIEIGRGYGLPLREQDFFSSDIRPESFDLITMFELIEHVVRPGEFLRRAEEVLRPGGLLYLTTPNFNSIDRLVLKGECDAIAAEHFSYFTPKTLSALVRRSTGMRVLAVITKNVSYDLVRRVLPRSRTDNGVSAKKAVRHRVEESAVLRNLKLLANIVLNVSRLGSSITMTMMKPDPRVATRSSLR